MRFVHWVVIPVALLGVLYCVGGVAAAHNEHTVSVGAGTAVMYMLTAACVGGAGFVFVGGVLYNFGDRGAVFLLALMALAVVVGDVWGAFQSVAVLGGGRRPWYDTWLPLSVAQLCWWITIGLGSPLVRAFLAYRSRLT